MNKIASLVKSPFFIITFIVAVILLLGGLRVMFYVKSPDVILLTDRSGAQWIKYDSDFKAEAKPSGRTKCEFKYVFDVNSKIDHAVISMQFLKKADVFLDGVKIFSSNYAFNQWKQVHDVKIPFMIEPGAHEISMLVTSENSYPSVIVYSEKLNVKTGPEWLASEDGRNWKNAMAVSRIKQMRISKYFPSSIESLVSILPYLAAVFVSVFFISLLAGRNDFLKKKYFHWRPEPFHIKWVLLFFWTVLSINNMVRLNYQVGTDGWGHIEYIDYIATKGSLPIAYDGWQMFQAPLNYILSAPLYALLIKGLDLPSVVKIMSIIPVICGMAQIEIVFRVAKRVFAERKDLQIIAIIAGSLIPVHTYACQYVGNEPLTALFISLAVLICVPLVMPDQREHRYGYFIVLGVVWGLALLSKMTAFLLAPVLLFVIAFHTRSIRKSVNYFLRSLTIVFTVSLLISGWYYFRNYLKLGNAFIGLFDPLQMMQWWQDPGYRTWSHLLSFGEALIHPVYAGVTSFWDMFYSTLWLDGLNSGLVDFIPWNVHFMIAGTLLALLPSIFLLTGVLSAWMDQKINYRNAVIFSAGLIVLFLLAMIDMYVVCPVYSRTKASYTLGLLPCYAVLIAAGTEPFLRNKIMRSFSLAFFACWAFAAYTAYFVVKFQ